MSSITEILKLKGNKDVLIPEGNWIAVEGGGTYKDYEYLIVLNKHAYRCGYVAIPPEHRYSKTPEEKRTTFGSKEYSEWNYDSLDINCHGGLTFMSPNHRLKDLLEIHCNDLWVGFDCGHVGDKCDKKAFKQYYGEEEYKEMESFFNAMSDPSSSVKNFFYTEKECQSIIEQLIEAA